MPWTVGTPTVHIAGDDATASAEVIVTDEKGAEVGRQTASARCNRHLRADDPNRRGMAVDADDRLAQLLAEDAARLAAQVLIEQAPFADFATTLAPKVAEQVPVVEAQVAEAEAKALEPVPLVVKDLSSELLTSEEVVTDGR